MVDTPHDVMLREIVAAMHAMPVSVERSLIGAAVNNLNREIRRLHGAIKKQDGK